jgi:outer membrane lipoprotein-sorting protein
MTITSLLQRCCFLLALAGLALPPAHAAEPAIIAKARTYLGSEAALAQVTTLRYTGMLVLDDAGTAAGPQGPVKVEIIFTKPSRQRSVITADKRVETTVLDGYEGWQKVQDPADNTRWQLSLLQADQIRSLRANVAENLSFFRNAGDPKCTVEDLGAAMVDGIACRKIAFIYTPQIAFYRYFDTASGRLVMTETQQGESIREQGEIVAGGVKFPRTLVTTLKRSDGGAQRITINFEQVTVNEDFPDSLFAMPSLGAP